LVEQRASLVKGKLTQPPTSLLDRDARSIRHGSPRSRPCPTAKPHGPRWLAQKPAALDR
jgi:hypothetical protein